MSSEASRVHHHMPLWGGMAHDDALSRYSLVVFVPSNWQALSRARKTKWSHRECYARTRQWLGFQFVRLSYATHNGRDQICHHGLENHVDYDLILDPPTKC